MSHASLDEAYAERREAVALLTAAGYETSAQGMYIQTLKWDVEVQLRDKTGFKSFSDLDAVRAFIEEDRTSE